jgi:hypothetical protein
MAGYPTIVIEGRGALCNRMRALESAWAMREAVGCEVIAVWTLNRNMGAPFGHLFEPVPGVHDFPDAGAADRFIAGFGPTLSINHGDRAFLRMPALEKARLQLSQLHHDTLAKHRVVYIRSWRHFWHRSDRLAGAAFEDFRPIAELRDRIAVVTARFDPTTIGVHVRRTDLAAAIRHGPTDLFVQRMRQAIDRGAETFFVATDEPEEEALLRAAFGERIVSYPKRTLARNDVAGVQDAIVDLYCLAATSGIIGSFGSTFCDVAPLIRRIPLEIVDATPAHAAA